MCEGKLPWMALLRSAKPSGGNARRDGQPRRISESGSKFRNVDQFTVTVATVIPSLAPLNAVVPRGRQLVLLAANGMPLAGKVGGAFGCSCTQTHLKPTMQR